MNRGRTTVIDACSLINLVAAGPVLGDLVKLGARFLIVEKVKEEALFILGDAQGQPSRMPIDCLELVARGVLSEAGRLSDGERDLLVGLVSENLHDGEAASAAVAICRKCLLLSDDARARAVMVERGYADSVLTTPEVLRFWSEEMGVEDLELRRVIDRVERCARFLVPREHPLKEWWHSAGRRRQP